MHKPFQKIMGENMRKLKADFPNLPNKAIFKRAVALTKKIYKPKDKLKKTFKVGKKGQPSATRKGRKNFETHKGDADFHEDHHDIKKKREPFKQTRKQRKQRKQKKQKKPRN